MASKKTDSILGSVLDGLREGAEQTRELLANTPGPSELLTPEELADAAPFYFVLREYIRELKEARLAAGLKSSMRPSGSVMTMTSAICARMVW